MGCGAKGGREGERMEDFDPTYSELYFFDF